MISSAEAQCISWFVLFYCKSLAFSSKVRRYWYFCVQHYQLAMELCWCLIVVRVMQSCVWVGGKKTVRIKILEFYFTEVSSFAVIPTITLKQKGAFRATFTTIFICMWHKCPFYTSLVHLKMRIPCETAIDYSLQQKRM